MALSKHQSQSTLGIFHYNVIESSGFGTDKFTMVRNNDGTGLLKVVQPLGYEDKLLCKGFRFVIQVNDKGEDNDKYHVAYCWANVKLRDINDNKPLFDKVNIETLVYENVDRCFRLYLNADD